MRAAARAAASDEEEDELLDDEEDADAAVDLVEDSDDDEDIEATPSTKRRKKQAIPLVQRSAGGCGDCFGACLRISRPVLRPWQCILCQRCLFHPLAGKLNERLGVTAERLL